MTTYPDILDTNDNLFLVRDSLRVTLLEDYNPGDTSITVQGSTSLFPDSGHITLTEQCNPDYEVRGISFYYGSKTATSFDDLEILPGFTDTAKPKRITNVTMNVMADHRNALKDALIAVQEFVGIKGTTDIRPLGTTMEGRLNYLRKLVLRPRAWFTVNKRIGTIPMKVKFTDLSFRNPTEFIWDMGDNSPTSSITTISVTYSVPLNAIDVLVQDIDGGDVEKTYSSPGIYSVKLTVKNEFGEDSITFKDLINARIEAPDEAIISFTQGSNQTVTEITDDDYLYTHLVPGIINARTGTLINLSVEDNGEQTNDPIVRYQWKLDDDLSHQETDTTKASYSIGGYFDIKLRVDTRFGAYRITTLEDSINIIEKENLFLVNYEGSSSSITRDVTAYEFGLVSETFKTKRRSSVGVTKDHRFLDSGISEYAQQKREFSRNNSICQRGTVFSGDQGTALMYWAEGAPAGSPDSAQTIRFIEYEGFGDVWRTSSSFQISRPWNWIGLNSSQASYILFGSQLSVTDSPTLQTLTKLEFTGLTTTTTSISTSIYKNGADELMYNVGNGTAGDFSVYRTTWRDNKGFILRNDGVSGFFRIKSFYMTEGILTDQIQSIRKMTDMPGSSKTEGQLVGLSNGVYFFNNSGEIAVYSPLTNVWTVGGPGTSSVSFRSLQDTSISGYDNTSNTLLAVSDNDRRAYLSYDYSTSAFIKFTESDLSFVSLPARPSGDQFVLGVF